MQTSNFEGTSIGKPLLLYALSTCGFCKKAMQYLEKRNLSYTVFFVDEMPIEEKRIVKEGFNKSFGKKMLFPTLLIGEDDYAQGWAGDGPSAGNYWAPWYGKDQGATLGYLITGDDAGYEGGGAMEDIGHWLVRTTPVPEPGAAWLVGLGLLLFAHVHRRSR